MRVKPREISEIITHLAFYSGWSNALSWHRWLLGTAFNLPWSQLGFDVRLGLAGVAAASVLAYLGWSGGRTAAPVDRSWGSVSARPGIAAEARRLARFSVWPAIGLASWAARKASGLAALEPFLTAGLLAHYWLDGRIWTARARRLGPL